MTPALLDIQSATKSKLNRDIEIRGITCPYFLARYGYFTVLVDAISQMQPSLEHGSWARSYFHNTRLAYGIDTAESLGYPPGADIGDEVNLLLHFDYQSSVLLVAITEITVDITLVLDEFRISDFRGDQQNASVRLDPLYAPISGPDNRQPEKLIIMNDRTKQLVKSVLAGSPPNNPAAKLSDVRRITFNGDSPASEFDKIRDTIVETFPEFEDLFAQGIDPRRAPTIGAAKLARLYKFDYQRFVGEPAQAIVDGRLVLHDEL